MTVDSMGGRMVPQVERLEKNVTHHNKRHVTIPHTIQFALKYCIENRERGYGLSIEYKQTAMYLDVLSIECFLMSLTCALNTLADGSIVNTQMCIENSRAAASHAAALHASF